jgi:hypothetical protein
MRQAGQASAGTPGCHVEGLQWQDLGLQRRGDVPTHDAPGVHVGDERDVRETGPRRDVGNVSHPQPPGARRSLRVVNAFFERRTPLTPASFIDRST